MNDTRASVLQLKPGDEVAIALRDIHAGEVLAPFGVDAQTDIAFGHKVALRRIGAGEVIHRFGQPVGLATAAIEAGSHVHLHNMGFEASMAARAIGTRLSNSPRRSASEVPSFDGYIRVSTGSWR